MNKFTYSFKTLLFEDKNYLLLSYGTVEEIILFWIHELYILQGIGKDR